MHSIGVAGVFLFPLFFLNFCYRAGLAIYFFASNVVFLRHQVGKGISKLASWLIDR